MANRQHPSVDRAKSITQLSIGEYLIRRLGDYSIRHVFGVPGDYVLGFYSMLEKSPLDLVNCTREDCAGYAADAYARLNGMGALCVTYGVGGLSVVNSTAGAWAEKSPVVVISGAPGLSERSDQPLLHHCVREWSTQLEVFGKVTAACAEITDPDTAFREIDRVLDVCFRQKRPVYIELPRDMIDVVPESIRPYVPPPRVSDPAALAEAVREAVERIEQAHAPVIIAGVELQRFGLQADAIALAEAAGIAVASTLLGKSAISEIHPLYIGLYEGGMGRREVTEFVESSDCRILLGTILTDIDLGIFTANLDPRRTIHATSDDLRISHHHFRGVLLEDFIRELARAKPKANPRQLPLGPAAVHGPFTLQADAPITISRLIRRLDQALNDRTIVIADVGDALFASSELVIRGQTEYISPAYYTSMGFATPATVGACACRPELKVVALIGDGAFQMTGMEASTLVARGMSPTLIVLDNGGYGTERTLLDGAFNDINPWEYQLLPALLGGGTGYEVRTEGDFDKALVAGLADRKAMSLIRVFLARDDFSTTIRRLGESLSKKVR
ncbi:MAG: alpha-keto acid decarboxylase family protein [Planctomycetota bacterium]|nr:MAG: alpha-keto acid decarboxylase family protein [Planctomycetota bacterium]